METQGLRLAQVTNKNHINIREVENGFVIQSSSPHQEYIASSYNGVAEIVHNLLAPEEESDQTNEPVEKGCRHENEHLIGCGCSHHPCKHC
jgi:hypothetical protein